MSNLIIDSHSHIGVGYEGRIAYPEEYEMIKKKNNIDISLLMPQPLLNKDDFRCFEMIDKANKETFEIINNSALRDSSYFVPMISPIYMGPNELENYIDFSYPEAISCDIIRIIKKYDIPLIVHTDYAVDDSSLKNRMKNLNSAIKWFDFFLKNEIKGYLTHGARLNNEVLRRINNYDNIVIGVGPDLLLQQYSETGLEDNTEYLRCLYDYVDPRRLLFDVDYNWNIDGNGNLDFDSIDRIKKYWSEEDSQLILGENSREFFKIKIKE